MYNMVSLVRSEILQHGQCGVSDQMSRDTTAWSVWCLWSDDQGYYSMVSVVSVVR